MFCTTRFTLAGSLTIALAVATMADTSHAATFTYDWSTATGSASPGTPLATNGANDNWSGTGAASWNVISNNQPDGFSGNYVSIVGGIDKNASRLNDGAFTYTIAPDATEVTLSVVLHLDGTGLSWGYAGLKDVANGSGEATFRIGFAGGDWVYRGNDSVEVEMADTGVSEYVLDTATSYRATAVFDLVGNTYSYTVDNLTGGGSVVLASNVAIAPAVANLDWSTYDGLFMRGRNISFDSISVSFVPPAPEPATAMLLAMGLVTLAATRRRRQRG